MISDIMRVGASISTPLALAGLVVVILYLLFRSVLTLRIFPKLTGPAGAQLLTRIVDRVFVLALVATFLGAGLYALEKLGGTPTETTPDETVIRDGLAGFYARDIERLFPLFPDAVTTTFGGLGGVSAMLKATAAQLPTEPISRRRISAEPLAGMFLVINEVQFDEVSTWRELLQLTMTGEDWKFWRIDLQPSFWTTQANQQHTYAGENIKAFVNSNAHSNSGADTWTPVNGWIVRVTSIGTRLAKYTCDVAGDDGQQPPTAVHLKAVLGGCDVPIGSFIRVLGRISTASPSQVHLEHVRFYTMPVPVG